MFYPILDALSEPAFCADQSGNILHINKTYYSHYNTPDKIIKEYTIDTLIDHTPDLSSISLSLRTSIKDTWQTGTPVTNNRYSIFPERAPVTEATCLFIILHEKRKQNSSGTDTINPLPGASFILAPDGIVTGWNQQACKTVFGLNNDDMTCLDIFTAVH